MSELKEYRVVWNQIPFAYSCPQVIFILAKDEEKAKRSVINQIERTIGLPESEFRIKECREVAASTDGVNS